MGNVVHVSWIQLEKKKKKEERSSGKDKDDQGSRRGRKVWICADIGR